MASLGRFSAVRFTVAVAACLQTRLVTGKAGLGVQLIAIREYSVLFSSFVQMVYTFVMLWRCGFHSGRLHATHTGKAIGFLFIPVFNIY